MYEAKKGLSPLILIVTRCHQGEHWHHRVSWTAVENECVGLYTNGGLEVDPIRGLVRLDMDLCEAVQIVEYAGRVVTVVFHGIFN